MDARALAEAVRTYRGVARKAPLGGVVEALGVPDGDRGEDAAVIDRGGGELLLLAADGIMGELVGRDPGFAGLCAVLVNVNDVVAMGGTPVALVDIVAGRGPALRAVLAGLREGSERFRVTIVGGHTHPDEGGAGVSAAVLGSVPRGSLLTSSGASPGEAIVAAVVLEGRAHPSWPMAWSPPPAGEPDTLLVAHEAVRAVAARGLATAAKDVSNPGLVGSLGMLLEASGVGGVVRAERVPRPKGIPLERWLLMYHACGFVLTTSRPEACVGALEGPFAAAVVGETDGSGVLRVALGGEEAEVADLRRGGISGMWGRRAGGKGLKR